MVNLNKLTAKQVQTFKADNKQVRYSDGGGIVPLHQAIPRYFTGEIFVSTSPCRSCQAHSGECVAHSDVYYFRKMCAS